MDEIAVVWFTKEEWPKVKACAKDVEVFSDTYEEWLAQAERTMRKMKKLGVPTVRMPVVAAELQAWCWAEGVPNTSANRAAFAARRLQKMRASGREEV